MLGEWKIYSPQKSIPQIQPENQKSHCTIQLVAKPQRQPSQRFHGPRQPPHYLQRPDNRSTVKPGTKNPTSTIRRQRDFLFFKILEKFYGGLRKIIFSVWAFSPVPGQCRSNPQNNKKTNKLIWIYTPDSRDR